MAFEIPQTIPQGVEVKGESLTLHPDAVRAFGNKAQEVQGFLDRLAAKLKKNEAVADFWAKWGSDQFTSGEVNRIRQDVAAKMSQVIARLPEALRQVIEAKTKEGLLDEGTEPVIRESYLDEAREQIFAELQQVISNDLDVFLKAALENPADPWKGQSSSMAERLAAEAKIGSAKLADVTARLDREVRGE